MNDDISSTVHRFARAPHGNRVLASHDVCMCDSNGVVTQVIQRFDASATSEHEAEAYADALNRSRSASQRDYHKASYCYFAVLMAFVLPRPRP